MSVNHCKFASPEKLITGQKTVVKHYSSIWKEMVKLRLENLIFSIHCRKRRSIALALNKLQKPDEPDTIVVYGAGSFASGRKNEKHVPVKWVKQEVARRYVTTEVDEFRTSSVCPDCDSQLYTVAEYRNDRFYEVRGLKWCYDLRCRATPLKHRDVVGAKMIFRRFKGDGPAILNRGSDVP